MWVAAIVGSGGLLTGCVNNPMFCTPETCVAVTDRDLPSELRGAWVEAADATRRLYVDSFTTSKEEASIVQSSAGIRWEPLPRGTQESWMSRVTSFDGEIGVAEQRVGADKRSPRRMYRLWMDGDRLHVAMLRLDALLGAYEKRDAKIVQLESGEALVYKDTRSMRYTLEVLIDEPEAWGEPVVYERAPGES